MSYEGDHESHGSPSPSFFYDSSPQQSSPMKTPNNLRCPICDQNFERDQTTAMPFCSARCRQVDLGRWLTESYGLPHEGNDAAEGFGPRDDGESAEE